MKKIIISVFVCLLMLGIGFLSGVWLVYKAEHELSFGELVLKSKTFMDEVSKGDVITEEQWIHELLFIHDRVYLVASMALDESIARLSDLAEMNPCDEQCFAQKESAYQSVNFFAGYLLGAYKTLQHIESEDHKKLLRQLTCISGSQLKRVMEQEKDIKKLEGFLGDGPMPIQRILKPFVEICKKEAYITS